MQFPSEHGGHRFSGHRRLRGDVGVGIVIDVDGVLRERNAQFASQHRRRGFAAFAFEVRKSNTSWSMVICFIGILWAAWRSSSSSGGGVS